jgi:hypothetical protein
MAVYAACFLLLGFEAVGWMRELRSRRGDDVAVQGARLEC